jgi:hypothetical protein
MRMLQDTGARIVKGVCTLDLEQTPESFHAYANIEGIEIRPGDSVLLHGAPAGIGFGERATYECQFTVVRAGWLARMWTQFTGLLELTELYEVGFMPKES